MIVVKNFNLYFNTMTSKRHDKTNFMSKMLPKIGSIKTYVWFIDIKLSSQWSFFFNSIHHSGPRSEEYSENTRRIHGAECYFAVIHTSWWVKKIKNMISVKTRVKWLRRAGTSHFHCTDLVRDAAEPARNLNPIVKSMVRTEL